MLEPQPDSALTQSLLGSRDMGAWPLGGLGKKSSTRGSSSLPAGQGCFDIAASWGCLPNLCFFYCWPSPLPLAPNTHMARAAATS